MDPTKEQLEAVRDGKLVRLNEEGAELVIVRADLFDRLSVLDYDASPWSGEEMDLLAAEDANRLGWEGMETYQDHEPGE